MKVNCSLCNSEFNKSPSQISRTKSGRHFCSRKCSATFNNKAYPKRSKEGCCLECSSKIKTSKKFCDSECRDRYKKLKECKYHNCQKSAHNTFCSYNCRNKFNVTKVRMKLKLMAIEYKGDSCENCGYDKCVDAFDFHHLDPTQKEFKLASGNTYKWETMKSELDKCILLCANCHRETHYELKATKYIIDMLESEFPDGFL